MEPEENASLALDEYLAADHSTRARVKNGGAWVPAVFVNNGSRKDTDVLAMTAAVLDFFRWRDWLRGLGGETNRLDLRNA